MHTRFTAPLLAAVALLAGSHAHAQQTLPVDQIVANMQQVYDTVNDFSADFRQEYTNMTLGETDVSTGELHFLKPGMMRWDYLSPIRFFIIDGSALWIYEPSGSNEQGNGQYYTQDLDDSDLPTALRFLMGQGSFAQDFEISLIESNAAGYTLELVPRQDESQYRKLQFVIDATTWRVNETVIFDPVGNTNRFVFTNRTENGGLVAADFQFTPPPGARQIEEPN
jgi:outer membrane lipoprotein carrier protein